MKLAEALIRRKDLINDIERLRAEMNDNAAVPEGEAPEEQPDALRERLSAAVAELEYLILRTNRTNLQESISRGMIIQEAIVRRDMLAREWRALGALREGSKPRRSRRRLAFREDEPDEKLVPTVDRVEVKNRLDEIAAERRRLDVEIQEANWTVELYE